MMMMMYEGKHIHYSPVDQRPLCSYSGKLCRQRRINGFAFCIRHILEDKSAPFKQCAHVAKYNNQKCSNPIPANEDREFCNSHMQVAGIVPKKERKNKKEKDFAAILDGKMKFSERVKVLLKGELDVIGSPERTECLDEIDDDPYEFPGARDLKSGSNVGCGSHSFLTTKIAPDLYSTSSNAADVARKEFSLTGGSDHVGSAVVKQDPNDKVSGCNSDRSKCCGISNNNNNNNNNNNISSGKNNTKKSSKSVNRLEAKINRNRILDKMKKNHKNGPRSPSTFSKDSFSSETALESSNGGVFEETNDLVFKSDSVYSCMFSSSVCEKTAVNAELIVRSAASECCSQLASATIPVATVATNASESVLDDYPCTRTTNKLIEILPKRRGWRWPWKRPELVPRSLQTYKRLWLEKRDLRTSQFPLGLEISDSESSDSDSDLYQREWFCPPADAASWLAEGGTGSFRSARSSVEKAELRRRCRQICHSQAVMAPQRRSFSTLARTLSRAARSQPAGATKLVEVLATDGHLQQNTSSGKNKWTKNLALMKQKCCYKNEDSECSNTALPYTRHCLKHIMYNVDQLLFEHCTAKFADNTQCCVPVFDICHELPLCLEHARKRDNYGKLSMEPKPKKPRKKTKPSALTRPPKRGKKKKRQSGCCRSESDLTAALMCQSPSSDMPPSSLHYGMSSDLSPSASNIGDHVPSDLDGPMEPDLSTDLVGQLSPGAMDKSLDLPMDAVELANQASRLLEDHDFTEVLNKIPDEAFRELFNDGKNGNMLPSREEAEELERALAAVDKDVKSLVKLSSAGHGLHVDLNDSILHGGDHNLNATLDTTLSELTASGMGIDVITSSLTSSDLNNLSQVLSTMAGDGPLSHIPMLSDMGFAQGGHVDGRIDDDVLEELAGVESQHATMHHQWTTATTTSTTTMTTTANERGCHHLHQVCGHNGLINAQHNIGHSALLSPRFASQASALVNASKQESKGGSRHYHYNNLGSKVTNLFENSLGLTSMPVTELTESSAESVS